VRLRYAAIAVFAACSRDPQPTVSVTPRVRDVVHLPAGSFRGVVTQCPDRSGAIPKFSWDGPLAVDPFDIDRAVVSCEAFSECARAGKCRALDARTEWGDFDRFEGCLGGVALVHIWSAERYCKFRGGVLPSSTEWQRAIRGLTAWRYPDGVQFVSKLHCNPTLPGPYDNRCSHVSADGVSYTTNDPAVREYTRDTDCKEPKIPPVDEGETQRASVRIGGSELNQIEDSVLDNRDMGVFRCAYHDGK
jgi:formylglycine-generating enzyme required for sulfatase activity